jgi:serine O-acetyltransferase
MKLMTREDLRFFLASDMTALGVKGTFKEYVLHDIWRFQRVLRHLEFHLNNRHRCRWMWAWFRWRRACRKLCLEIPPNVFGPGLKIAHAGGIFINAASRVGPNCLLHQSVTLGTTPGKGVHSEAPTIGRNCYIGPGAVIFGPITIGDNVAIGANSVVNKSFPSDCTIAGAPARIVSQKGSKGYLTEASL